MLTDNDRLYLQKHCFSDAITSITKTQSLKVLKFYNAKNPMGDLPYVHKSFSIP